MAGVEARSACGPSSRLYRVPRDGGAQTSMVPRQEEVEALVVRREAASATGRSSQRSSGKPRRRAPFCRSAVQAGGAHSGSNKNTRRSSQRGFGIAPMLLERSRECLRDVFKHPSLVETLNRRRENPEPRRLTRPCPSPFAAALFCSGMSPTTSTTVVRLYAERHTQALAIDQGATARASW